MPKRHWLVKQEPEAFSWDDLVREKSTAWTGVRNFQARNYLRAMQTGDLVCFYHSRSEKRVIGLARVIRESYPDPTADEGDWSSIDLAPVKPLLRPVGLAEIKADPILGEIPLVKQSRLSVSPLSERQFKRLLELAQTPA